MSYLLFSKREKSLLQRKNSQETLKKIKNISQLAQSESELQSSVVTSGFIGTFEDAPSFMRENIFIKSGYRIRNHTPKKVLKSMFKIHNETVNIWTHLIPLTVVLFVLFQVASFEIQKNNIVGKKLVRDFVRPYILQNKIQCRNKNFPDFLYEHEKNKLEQKNLKYRYSRKKVPTWPLTVNLLGAAFCLACSVTYHLFRSSTKYFFLVSRSLDFAGIGICLSLSSLPVLYYEFYCKHYIGITYNMAIVFSGAAFSYFSVKADGNRTVQLICISVYSTFTIMGLTHLFLRQFAFQHKDNFTLVPSLYFYIPAALSILIGAIVLFQRCPQRYHPGSYDLCGQSHQIWHICVVITLVCVHFGSLTSYQMRALWINCHGSCIPFK